MQDVADCRTGRSCDCLQKTVGSNFSFRVELCKAAAEWVAGLFLLDGLYRLFVFLGPDGRGRLVDLLGPAVGAFGEFDSVLIYLGDTDAVYHIAFVKYLIVNHNRGASEGI
jgi:hypothetical protein